MWVQKQRWVRRAEGLISTTSRDHFAATSVANPLLGEGMSTLTLPGITFKTENIHMLQ